MRARAAVLGSLVVVAFQFIPRDVASQSSPFFGFVNATGLVDALHYCHDGFHCGPWTGAGSTFGLPFRDAVGSWKNVPLPAGTPVTKQFIADGVWLEPGMWYQYGTVAVPGINGWRPNVNDRFSWPRHGEYTDNGWLTNTEPIPDGGVTDTITLHFTNDVSAAAFGFATGHAFTTLTAFNSGVEVGRSTWNSDFDRYDIAYRGFVPTTDYVGRYHTFDEIQITFSRPVTAWLDNVQFVSAVPEPASVSLFAIGIALVGGARWLRTKLRR